MRSQAHADLASRYERQSSTAHSLYVAALQDSPHASRWLKEWKRLEVLAIRHDETWRKAVLAEGLGPGQ